MKIITSRRTIHAANLQTSLLLNKQYNILPNSTLNEKFAVADDVALTANERPTIGYFTIGRGGHQAIAGSDGGSNIGPVPQFASHSALYSHLPFVLRPINDDLGDAERAKYALRRVESHGGSDYIAYYLKRIDLDDVNVLVEFNHVLGTGETTTIAYVPRVEDLNPTPLNIPVSALPTDGDSLTALATVPLIFGPNDVTEFRDACNVIYNDTAYAVVSEIGICSGVDRMLLSPSASGEINFNEAIGVQILSMLTTHQALNFNNGFTLNVALGSAEAISI